MRNMKDIVKGILGDGYQSGYQAVIFKNLPPPPPPPPEDCPYTTDDGRQCELVEGHKDKHLVESRTATYTISHNDKVVGGPYPLLERVE